MTIKFEIAITVPWPVGNLDAGTGFSADPNDHFRSWLESNVGQQHQEWNWDVCSDNPDKLNIYFAKHLEPFAIQAAFMWS